MADIDGVEKIATAMFNLLATSEWLIEEARWWAETLHGRPLHDLLDIIDAEGYYLPLPWEQVPVPTS